MGARVDKGEFGVEPVAGHVADGERAAVRAQRQRANGPADRAAVDELAAPREARPDLAEGPQVEEGDGCRRLHEPPGCVRRG